ncbi:hypothetical protein Hanom_Chr06g00532191 [Helianthus anomalus]
MHEKRLRYWFVKDGKRKRTPKVSRRVVAPNVVIKGKFERDSHIKEPAKKKSPPRLIDETVIPPADVIPGGVDLLKETHEDFLKKNYEAEAAKAAKVQVLKRLQNLLQRMSKQKVLKKKMLKPEIDTSTIGVGKITLKVKPQKKRKDSNEEDSTYIPSPEEKKKLRKKRKAVQSGVIPRNVRARKRSAIVPEMQSGKAPEVQVQSTLEVQAKSIPEFEVQSVNIPEVQTTEVEKEKVSESLIFEKVEKNVEAGKDDDEVVFMGERVSTPPPPPPPENPTIHIPDNPEQSKLKKINDLSKKVCSLEKAKAKAEAERDDLKKKLEKSLQMNEEMKLVLSEVNAKYENMNETNKTLHQMLDDLHEASSNENKVLKLEIEALRVDKAVKDGQLNMLYIVMERQLGINVQAMYNDLEIQRVEERIAQREKELAKEATQKKKELIVETQEVGGSSSQHGGNDVEMVDEEVNAEVENMDVDQDQSFLLVGESVSLPYSLNDVIRMLKVEQQKGKVRAADVKLLCYREETKEEKEQRLIDELEKLYDDIYNYPENDNADDDDDQGATGLLIVKPSVQQSLDDFLNDELNEQVEDQHQESSSSGKQHADQRYQGPGKKC